MKLQYKTFYFVSFLGFFVNLNTSKTSSQKGRGREAARPFNAGSSESLIGYVNSNSQNMAFNSKLVFMVYIYTENWLAMITSKCLIYVEIGSRKIVAKCNEVHLSCLLTRSEKNA